MLLVGTPKVSIILKLLPCQWRAGGRRRGPAARAPQSHPVQLRLHRWAQGRTGPSWEAAELRVQMALWGERHNRLSAQKQLFHKLKSAYSDVDNTILSLSSLILAIDTVAKELDDVNLNAIKLRRNSRFDWRSEYLLDPMTSKLSSVYNQNHQTIWYGKWL